MIQFIHTVTDKNGLHARPAGLLAKEAGKYISSVKLTNGEKQADAKRILSVMTLAAKYGDSITVNIDGEDESLAKDGLEAFLNNNL